MNAKNRMATRLAMALLAAGVAQAASAAAADSCGPDTLGTARTLVLKREFGAWGTVQHGALPLQPGEVVLTFDDGPRAESTPLVLEALARQCVKATFFMVGARMDEARGIAQQVAGAGHSTGLHSYAHPGLSKLTVAEQLDDLRRGLDSYRAAFGAAPPAYRFPFLDETPAVMDGLKEKGIAVFSVDFGIEDWQENDTTPALAARLAAQLKAGSGGIVLLHDAHQATADALPALLKVLKDNGMRVVHVQWQQ